MLIKEIGTDALFGLLRVASAVDAKHGTELRPARATPSTSTAATTTWRSPWRRPTSRATDRSAPSAQADPDLYVRIVERRADGIVVRGAKAHTSVSTNANELIVLPTRAMAEADRDYAVSFAIPLDTPGPRAAGVGLRLGGAAGLAGRAPDQRAPQDDGDDDRLRRRVRAVGAGVPGRRVTSSPARWRSRSSSTTASRRSPTSCRWSTRWSARRC